MSAQYLLSKHAHLCTCSGDLILLDVRSGKYIGLSPSMSAALAGVVKGWPVSEAAGQGPVIRHDDTLRSMLEKGLLTTSTEQGKDASPVHLAAPADEISVYFHDRPPPIRITHVLVFLWVVIHAALTVRFLPLRRIVARFDGRRATPSSDPGKVSVRTAAELVSVYNRLRLLTFSAKDHCFFDSYVLRGFLGEFDVPATWVFGVQTSPFAAHCWIQYETTVLNDSPLRVGKFTPIMVA